MTEQSRSYEDLGPGQQLYRVIEMCTDPSTLFAKIESGHWDWLGVQASGERPKFLLGRPAIRRSGLGVAGVAVHHGASGDALDRRFGVQIRIPLPQGSHPDESWWGSPEEARADFERRKEQLKDGEGSGLFRLRLLIDGQTADEAFIVRALPNRL